MSADLGSRLQVAKGGWPTVFGALLVAALIGMALSIAAAIHAGGSADRLNRQIVPLGARTVALDGAMNEMDGAVRAFLGSGAEAQLASYHAAQQGFEADVRAAQPLAQPLGDRLPARLGQVVTSVAAWQRDGADPAIARRPTAAALDAAQTARADALLGAYRSASADLRASVRRAEKDARAALSTDEALRNIAGSVTVVSVGLVALLAGWVGLRRLRRRLGTLHQEARAGRSARNVLDGLRDAVLVIDAETQQLRDANAAAERLSGRSRTELAGLPVTEQRTSDLDRGVVEAMRAALTAGDSADAYRLTWVQPNGVRAPLEGVNGLAVAGGEPLLVAVLRDLRGRLAAGEQLGGSRDELEAILQGVADGILVQEPAGAITYANDTAARILGYPAGEALIGPTAPLPSAQFAALDERGEPLAPERLPSQRVLHGEPEVEAVLRFRGRETAEERWVAYRASAMRAEDGSVKFVLSVLHDLTALIRAQEELRRSRDQLAAILRGVADGITVLEPGGRLVYANEAAAQLLGQPEPAALVRMGGAGQWRPFTVVNEAGAAVAETELPEQRALAGEAAPELLVCLRPRAGGDERWLELKSTPTFDEQGRVQFAVNVLHDVGVRRRAERLEHEALTDALTGLPNRRLVDDRLQQAILVARRNNGSVALLFLDLNKFKEINDTFGHQAGDVLLQAVSGRLQKSLRASDTVARLGGDEFMMILPGALPPGAVATADKVIKSLERPFAIEGQLLRVGASIGIAFYPEDAQDAATLTRHADAAMYAAKRSGTGKAIYRPGMEEPTAATGAEPRALSA